MAGGGGSSGGGFESYLPIAAALAATVMTDGAAAPMLEESLGTTGAAAVMGGGIGALTGGATAALTGQNVMQNALMGGIGGATLGYGGLYEGAPEVAAGSGLTAAGTEVAPAAAPSLGGSVAGGDVVLPGANSSIVAGTSAFSPSEIAAGEGIQGTTPYLATLPGGTVTSAQAASAAAANAAAANAGATGLGSTLMHYAPYGVGALALGSMLQNDAQHYGGTAQAAQPYTGGNLAKFKYDPNQYTPAVAVPPNPAYQANYSGYARPPGYAGGGLMDPNSEPVDFMGGDMYPQSQQHTSAYATPTQMPATAQATASLYEPKTNPLTGDEVANMNTGGYGKDALADLMNSRNAIEKYKSQYAQDPSTVISAAKGGDYNAMLAMNQIRGTPNANYAGGGVVAFDNGGQAQLTPDQMAQMQAQATQQQAPQYDPYSELQQQAMYARMAGLPQITPTSSAQGGLLSSYAGGGGISSLGGYSDGGRMLKGPGDGMSDSIPATIADKRPARLADNEFVVPADVVSHLGNGSSDAGAKKLYAMMDKVRKARTGKAKQAPAIKADKYMPA